MIDLLGAGDSVRQGGVIEDGALQEAAVNAFKIASKAAAQVIEHRDLGLRGEVAGQVGADEARPAGDEDALTHARATSACMAGS